MVSGVLYFQRIEQQKRGPDDGVRGLLVAPASLQRILLENCHDNPGLSYGDEQNCRSSEALCSMV